MLKVFRDNLKYLSWILWVVILVFILFMAVQYQGVSGTGAPNDSAAKVGGEEISYGELQRAYRQAEEAYRDAYGSQFTPELARQLKLPLQVLEQLVRQRILLAEAERMGLMVSDTELQRELLDLPVFQDDQGRFVGAERYRKTVRSLGYGTPEAFESEFRRELLLSKLNKVLADNIVVTGRQVEDSYRAEAERAKIRYIRLPVASFRGQVETTPEEVQAYFESHREDFRLPERRGVDYLLVDADAIRQGLQISDEDLEAYYREHIEDYTTEEQVRARQILIKVDAQRSDEEARQEMEAIRKRLDAGENFADLARELSEDPVSAPQGGDLGSFSRGQILDAVEKAAFAAKPGDIVGPVKSSFGYHLIQVVDHTPGGQPPFSEMREAVERRVLSERSREAAEARAKELADQLERSGAVGEEALETLADEQPAVSFHSTEPFGRADNVPGIGRSTPFSAAAFSLEKGTVSPPVRVGAGWAILSLSEVIEPRLPELDEVRDDVAAALAAERAGELALKRMAALREEISSGKSLDDAASELGVEVEESSEFTRDAAIGGSLGTAPEVNAAALDLEAGAVGEPLLSNGTAVLFQVAERHHFDPDELAERRDSIRKDLESQQLNGLLAALVGERREELQVSYDPRLTQNLGLEG